MSELVGAAVVGGFHDATHHAIEVKYNCTACAKQGKVTEFRCTYEIMPDGARVS